MKPNLTINRRPPGFAVALTLCPALPAALLVMLLVACARPGGGASPDPASGTWTGAWYRVGEREPAGALGCRLEPAGPGVWEARFETGADVEANYELRLRGRREGSRVVFGGSVDLGAAGGGIYQWSGEIDGEVFQGTFQHPSGDGRFEMLRRRDAAIPPGN